MSVHSSTPRSRIPLVAGCITLLILGLGSRPRRSFADEITLPATQDNTIYSESDSSYGRGLCLQVGRPGISTPLRPFIRRALIRFDLTSIPPGSNIVSARFNLFRYWPGGTGTRLWIHKVVQDWGEGSSGEGYLCTARPRQFGRSPTDSSSTWNYSFFGARTVWRTEAGDPVHGGYFQSSPTDSEFLPYAVSQFGFESQGITSDVMEWVEDPASNHGWILRGDEKNPGTGMRFASREDHLAPERAPTLTVFFTPPTGACCKPDGTCDLTTASDCSAQSGIYGGASSTCAEQVCLEPYVDALPIPAVAMPVRGRAAGAFYDMAMREFKQKLHRDLPPTTLWGYNGQYPGPTIEAYRNQPVHVRWINDLRDLETGLPRTVHYFDVDTRLMGPDVAGKAPRTVVHLHGGHVPPDADGFPESTFVSGGSRLYRYPNTQLPATLWYHDHALGITRYNVMMGLAGLYVIRDRDEEALQLPRGPYEIPLLLQDRSFHPDGSLRYPAQWDNRPFLGDKVLVNGKVWPQLRVDRGKYRFRVVNGSNHRIFTLALSDHHRFQVIGTDGGLLSSPVEVGEISLAPAERAELVLDFEGYPPDSEVLLIDTLEAGQMDPLDPSASRIMKFIVSGTAGWIAPLAPSLSRVERIPESQATRTRTFEVRFDQNLQKFRFGDFGWGEATEFPVLGSTEIWQFANETIESHPIHMHLEQFQILDRSSFQIIDGQVVPGADRRPPGPEEAGWKDTAKVGPRELLRVIMRFGPDGYLGDYVLHCHMLEHEDNDMMRQFTVVPPKGTKPVVATARADPGRLWPPDGSMAPVKITGVSDSTGAPVPVHVTGVTQDEPIAQCLDAEVLNGQLYLRRERQGGGNGRVYRVSFTALSRDGGTADGSVLVGVPREAGTRLSVNDGQTFNSLRGCPGHGGHMEMAMDRPSGAGQSLTTSLGLPRVEGSRAVVEYTLAQPGEVSVAVFDIAGRRVAAVPNARHDAGVHRVSLPLGRIAHGIYFVKMRAGEMSYVRRMPILRTAK